MYCRYRENERLACVPIYDFIASLGIFIVLCQWIPARSKITTEKRSEITLSERRFVPAAL